MSGMDRTFLQCRECKKEYDSTFKYICDECFGPLDVHYHFPSITKDIFTSRDKPTGDILNYFQSLTSLTLLA